MGKELSLETRASSVFVQGRLEALLVFHNHYCGDERCACIYSLPDILDDWKQAEAELQAARKAYPHTERDE